MAEHSDHNGDDPKADTQADTPSASHNQHQPRKLPSWLDHFNRHDLKILLRCSVAAWVALILSFIQPSLQSIGIATFFASLVLLVVPPASALLVYLLGSVTLLFGMCLAWAWGLLTMKAALAARPDSETNAKLQALQQQAVAIANQTGQSPELEAQILVHEGFMLDARVTAVYFSLGCLLIYALARLRCSNPKFALTQIFGTIITDLFLLIGPGLPSFNSSLAEILIKPGAIGAGLGAACCVLIFPQSTSHLVLGKMQKLLALAEAPLKLTRRRLQGGSMSVAELKAVKYGMVATYKAMEPLLTFLPLDFSRCRWNAEDVQGLTQRVRKLMLSCNSLLDFHVSNLSMIDRSKRIQSQRDEMKTPGSQPGSSGQEKDGQQVGRQQIMDSADLLEALRNPEASDIRERNMATLSDTTSGLLNDSSEAVGLINKTVHLVSSHRWVRTPSPSTFDDLSREVQEKLESLRATRETCLKNTTEELLETHGHLFDESGNLIMDGRGPLPLQGFLLSMVYEERLAVISRALEDTLEYISRLLRERKTNRIWVPTKMQYALSWVLNGRASVSVFDKSDDTTGTSDPDTLPLDPTALEEQKKEAHRRLNMSRVHGTGTRRRGWFNRLIVGTYRWLFDPSGMFALRMVVVTIATSIPAVIPHSAGFFYREKGIWFVISAQTCLLVYMADMVFSIVSRGLGTVIGGVMAMLAWYIGSGSGGGNPYGLSAICAVMIPILIWWRIFLPPQYAQATILTGATFVLVVGFSYENDHLASYGLPGIGYVAFWKRLVTVLLGFVASIIVQIFPKTPSASTHVEKSLANVLSTLSDHYAVLLSHWGRNAETSPLGAVAEKITLGVTESLLSLNPSIALLGAEMAFGPFDQASLRQVQEHCQYLNQAMGSLISLSTSLPRELQTRLVNVAGILDNHTVGDVMAVLNILEQSLRNGQPLPERLPTPLIGKFHASWKAHGPADMLRKDLIRNEDYRRYSVAVSEYIKLLTTVDELVLVMKRALGEAHILYEWEEA